MPLIRPLHASFGACIAAILIGPPPARADGSQADKQACVSASTDGQALRDNGKLREAREKLVMCARDECPVIVRKYCAEWLAGVESRIPSVVFRAQTPDGADVTDARVTVDAGSPHAVDGSATQLDPGEHRVRFEHPGDPPVEMRIVVAESEKGRIVAARFAPKAEAPTAEAPEPVETRPAPPPESKGIPPLAIALAGVGVLGGVGFAIFGITAKSNLDQLRQTCAPTCAPSDLDGVKQKAAIADVSLGVGLVALGAAAWVFFSSGSSSPPPASAVLDVRPTPGGAVARFGTQF
jgi:hypothetical protein